MSNVLMPKYRLYIGGKEIDGDKYAMIQSITYEDNASGSDLLTINIEDPDFLYINDNIFIEENKVKFIGGYDTDNRVMFEGYISLIDMDFPDNGSPSLVIHCMDYTHLMNRVKKKRTWNNTTRGAVAKKIFKEYGLSYTVHDSGKVEETISQSNETDINFLIKLADEEIDPYLIYVEGKKGFYVKKQILAKEQAVLDYREGKQNLLSFSPTINKETKQVEVRSSNVNLKSGKVDKAQANDNTSRNVQGKEVQSTDSSNGKSSWTNNNKGWKNTY